MKISSSETRSEPDQRRVLLFAATRPIVPPPPPPREPSEAFATFNTPNVVHFCAALLVAAILSAPWQALWNAGLLLGLSGLGGATYVVIVLPGHAAPALFVIAAAVHRHPQRVG
jgi:hypothetical protein